MLLVETNQSAAILTPRTYTVQGDYVGFNT